MKKSFFSLLLVTLCAQALSQTEVFPSGLMKSFQGKRRYAGKHRVSRDVALQFLQEEFSSLQGFNWVSVNQITDKTHTHLILQWTYRGRPVLDRFVKVHVATDGTVEMASNTLEKGFELALNEEITARRALDWEKKIRSDWEKKLGAFKGRIKVDPIIWMDPKTFQGVRAFDIRVVIDKPWIIKHYVIEEEKGTLLEEKEVARRASAPVKVFKKSPAGSASPDSVTLTDLNNTSSLRNSFLWVRRDILSSLLEVEPVDYTGAGFNNSPTPGQYDATCTGNNLACKNISFDAVNAYYHLSNYRTHINNYLSQLGASVSFPYDAPVNSNTGETNTFSVLVNAQSISLDFDSNNALYVGEPCRSDGSMERCLLFLRPAQLSSENSARNCGTSSSTLYDLAREAVVVAHEYQHYVTDTVTHISFSQTAKANVGDALHEAYSDYLAASYVTELHGSSVTLVGEYALSECVPLQRELGVLRPYDDSDSSNADPHTSGISWASAFWQLREEYGATVADLLAMKSLFFLSTSPGFIESVEAVVKADESLYQGEHVGRIRRLFYDEVKFTGGATVGADGLVELGFKGCGAVHSTRPPNLGGGVALFAWLFLTLRMAKGIKKGET